MKFIKAFFLLIAVVGGSTLIGSAAAAAVGHRWLFVGAFSGGLLGSWAAAWLAGRFQWIPPEATKTTALGAGAGFLAAAVIAVNTLHTPIGPLCSFLLIGVGGLLGARRGRR